LHAKEIVLPIGSKPFAGLRASKGKMPKKEAAMKCMRWGIALSLVTLSFGQQPGRPQTSPPYGTPPTFPEGRQAPTQPTPPDQEAPRSRRLSSTEARQQIAEHLNSEPALENTNVDVKVDQDSVELKGTVSTAEQHDLALRIAQSYAGDRKIVDKIKLRRQT